MLNILLYFLVKDIKSRYAGSIFGFLWAFLLPVLQIALFWFFFAGILKARPYAHSQIPYIYFLLSSFFFWLAFSEGVMRSASIVVENAEIVKRVPFPNVLLPIAATLASYIHHLIGFVIFFVLYSSLVSFHISLFLVIPILTIQIIFSFGIGMLVSALLPYMRDLNQIVGFLLQGVFFLSPIMYSAELIPERFRWLFGLNPFAYFATTYQKIILFRELPDIRHIGLMLLFGAISFSVGRYVFKKLQDGFSDVL